MKQNITQLFSCDKNLLSWGPMTRGGGSIRAGRPPGTCRGCRRGRGRWTPPCPADLSAGQASPTAPAPQPCDPRLRYNSIRVHMDRAKSTRTTAVWPAPALQQHNSTYGPRQQRPHHSRVTRAATTTTGTVPVIPIYRYCIDRANSTRTTSVWPAPANNSCNTYWYRVPKFYNVQETATTGTGTLQCCGSGSRSKLDPSSATCGFGSIQLKRGKSLYK